MEPVTLYLVFALTTSICCWLFYYVPLVEEAKRLGIVNTFTRSPILSSAVYILISIVLAPSLFLPLFSKKHGERFKHALRQEILKQH